MKPQIIIPVSLLLLAFVLSANNSFAARKELKKVKIENSGFKAKALTPVQPETDRAATESKNNRPAKPQQKENKKESAPYNESHKKAHSEEDGKHHHFHMHRAKRIKRHCNLVCVLAKLLLVISHICLLFAVFQASLAH